MSTFGGKIQEFPGISVDRFDGDNEQSQVYFLSHCHTDHMVGLGSGQFQKNLIDNGKYLFGSPISCIILSKLYPDIKNNLKELSLYLPMNVMLENGAFSVTTLPAGHCPGSVMFLFEGNKRILYTGDFRIHKGDIRKFKSFYDSFNNVKSIDKIYLDTTFFSKEFFKFPKREDSLNELCMIIKEWLDMGSLFMINLITSAKYGYEYLFIEIYRKLGMPIHVNQEIYDFYCLIPEMDKSITIDGSVTRIHSSCGPTYQSTCYKPHGVVKPVKVSAFRWNQENLSKGISDLDPYMHYVCYSTHASYEEAVDLIQFLKPKEVEICVKPSDPLAYSNLKKSIEEILEEFEEDEAEETGVDENVPKLFNIDQIVVKDETKNGPSLEVKKQKNWKLLEEDDLTTIMDLQPNDPYGHMLDSPPRDVMKASTDVLTTIMDLSPAKRTLKGIIKRKKCTLNRERSFTLLDSVTETSSCSSQWEESNYMVEEDSEPNVPCDELKAGCGKNVLAVTYKSKLGVPSSKKDVKNDYKSRTFLDETIYNEFDPKARKKLSADETVTSKSTAEVLSRKTVIKSDTSVNNEFIPLADKDLSADNYTTSKSTAEELTSKIDMTNINEPRKHSDVITENDEFDLRLRKDLFANESITDRNTAESPISGEHELCDIRKHSEELVTERNFLLEILESETNPIGEMETIANESETEADCSDLYDILGISPPQK